MALVLQSRPAGSSQPWSTLNSYREANAAVPERDTAARAKALREIRTRAAADAHSWDTNYHHGSREYRVHDTAEAVRKPSAPAPSRLPEYRVESDREGFYVVMLYGDDELVDVTPRNRWSRWQDADEVKREFERADAEEAA